jgi:hypothetical protein
MAARKCFASLTTVKLLTLEKVITLSGMALTEKGPRIESKSKLIMKSSTQKSSKILFFLINTLHLPQILQHFPFNLFFGFVQFEICGNNKSLS